ncbi:beta-ketoacyl synthase N-terminal-like domain-containing protein [Psychromonas sp. CD1]|uniref:beta-ketoacyl synthase N-terminal-like domain-containing protein n=1 Tax=Psychromonas sp. CD1 TaxID=1979839 RepID=UPI000B9C0183|nr:beta-ketoacyl synthase N-terminal-like domain-containing protein [Psychromonas sp. CD1]
MENIAIVGIANLFPGSSQPDEFWTQLLNKQDLRTKITEQEMGVDPMQYFGQQGDVDKFYCLYGGYIRNFNFDVSVFKHPDFDENYLMSLDELNKWALYVTYQALQNAGYWGSACLQKCGLILGNLSFPTRSSNHLFLPFYHHIVEQALQHVTQSSLRLKNFSTPRKIEADNGLVAGYPSALLAKIAGIGGAHFSLDAACASSCYSLKLACDMLHTGEVDMMLAGAVSAADPMFVNMGFSIFHAFPDNDIHAPFDSASKGLFAGEGAGMMVLKRHSDALRDGDTIHAVIKGGALSNDGKGEFILSPSSKGQVLAYHRAYADADVSPSDVGYIECHTTGTPKGDKVELNSMETFFSLYQNKPFLGSAKSNLGHLLTAAGMPGMIKAIYALNEGQIPATISLKNAIKTKQGYLTQAQMPTETVVWETSENKPRIAGVSVFGFGGSNAHLVLEGANAPSITNFKRPEPRRLMSIVGMDCLLTGINSLVQFDALLKNNKNTFTDLPLNRWKGIQNNANVMRTLGLGKVPRGGYIEKFDIDFLRFKVPPNAQDCLIPQQLMMMKVADNAARDANLKEGTNVAVLVAMGMELEMHQYRGRVNLSTQIRQSLQEQGIDLTAEQQEELINIAKESIASPAQLNQYTSFIGNLMASRIAALWDFSGPAFTVSSEENSVYRCVQIAQSLFATSDVEAVIIASVDLAGSFENISLRQRYGPVSESAISHSDPLLNKEWLIGEGAGAIVLQRSHAQDMRYAQIDALSFATGSDAQAIKDASYKACQLAQIKCADIDYVEAFASGFDLDNKAEIKAFAHLYPKVKIDSIKRQIGHLFNASGMFSLIKSALLVNAKEIKCVAINGLGKDMSCAHLLMSSAQPERKIKYITTPERAFSLVKPIYLGGVDIKQTILNAPVKNVFKRIKTQLQNKPAGTLSNGINLSPLKIFKDTSVLVAPLISLEATMKPPVKTKISSEIHQQAQAQQVFLRARQVAEQQIAILIKLQIKNKIYRHSLNN